MSVNMIITKKSINNIGYFDENLGGGSRGGGGEEVELLILSECGSAELGDECRAACVMTGCTEHGAVWWMRVGRCRRTRREGADGREECDGLTG